SVMFSSATSAVLSAGHAAALRIVIREPERAAHCLKMGALLAQLLREGGARTNGGQSQIVSLFFKGQAACPVYGALREQRILTSVFVYPAVPMEISMVRFSVYS